jgi:tripeptide aminopeptidase
MRNASLVAMEFEALLPAAERPERTENYEGFFHLLSMKGGVEEAELSYIIRDHDAARFEARKETMRQGAKFLNERYGENTVKLELRDQYRNMAEVLSGHMDVVGLADAALRKAGLEPKHVPIRGGTDGAQLSARGLPCPNLGTGGACFHGPYEHISVENMDLMVKVLKNLVCE